MEYELTPWIEHETAKRIGRRGSKKKATVQLPMVVPKGSDYTYREVVLPCLTALADSRFQVASGEFQDALDAYRSGDLHHALTSCGATLESVLKTICSLKLWPYNPKKDALHALLRVCEKKGLFPSLYTAIIQSVGTIRNKLGSAHGRGPVGTIAFDRRYVEHCVALTAAHVSFLVNLANM